jgi:uncharacterized protein (DUF2384 family)
MANAPSSRATPPRQSNSDEPLAEPTRELTNYRELVDRVVEAFGDEIKASRWLSLPNSELNGETPLQAVQRSDYDAEVLEPILTRIEHGIYS